MVFEYFPCNCLSVGLSVCLSVCLLEPPHFLWKQVNLAVSGALKGSSLLEFVLECLSGRVVVLGFVLELSGFSEVLLDSGEVLLEFFGGFVGVLIH